MKKYSVNLSKRDKQWYASLGHRKRGCGATVGEALIRLASRIESSLELGDASQILQCRQYLRQLNKEVGRTRMMDWVWGY